jgi:hypothetical protein
MPETRFQSWYIAITILTVNSLLKFLNQNLIQTVFYMKISIFWDITPSSPLKINRSFGRTCRLHHQDRWINRARTSSAFTLDSCLAYSSTLKTEETCPSETSVDFQRTTRQYIPEDRTVHDNRYENLQSYIIFHLMIITLKYCSLLNAEEQEFVDGLFSCIDIAREKIRAVFLVCSEAIRVSL